MQNRPTLVAKAETRDVCWRARARGLAVTPAQGQGRRRPRPTPLPAGPRASAAARSAMVASTASPNPNQKFGLYRPTILKEKFSNFQSSEVNIYIFQKEIKKRGK